MSKDETREQGLKKEARAIFEGFGLGARYQDKHGNFKISEVHNIWVSFKNWYIKQNTRAERSEEAITLHDADAIANAGSLDTLRDAIIVAHGMASGNYTQTDTVMRGRIAKHLEKTIRADKTMCDFLEWEENRSTQP